MFGVLTDWGLIALWTLFNIWLLEQLGLEPKIFDPFTSATALYILIAVNRNRAEIEKGETKCQEE